MSLVGFRGKNHRQQVSKKGARDDVDDRGTPAALFAELDMQHAFTLDVAASKSNAKCKKFFTIKENGLEQSWGGEVVWCNPPYSNIGEWVFKAINETLCDCPKVVLLLPANRCEQAWWQDAIENRRDIKDNALIKIRTKFLRGRHRFEWPPGRVVPPKGDRPPFGLVVVTIERSQ